jgi:hypothetical protein
MEVDWPAKPRQRSDGLTRITESIREGETMTARRFFANLISGDSHVMEPYDLWWKASGPKFGDRTPRVLDEYQGRTGAFFQIPPDLVVKFQLIDIVDVIL